MDETLYKNIVVGFDGSEFSRAALAEAAHWVQRHGGRLTMVHTVYFDEEEFGNAPEQIDMRFEVGQKLCRETKDDFSSSLGIAMDSIVCQGEPPEMIASIAREKGADLIAMGTYGRRGLKRILMGSVTSSVIVNSPCDVMVVKKPCSDCAGKYGSVLVPFDGSESSRKALLQACRLAKSDGGEITVLYVIPRYEEMIGFMKTESIRKSLHQEAEKITGEAKTLAASHGISVGVTVREGQANEGIVEIAGMLKSDVIVMGSYGWKGVNRAIMGSTAERVIMNAPCPVLVVK